MEQGNVLCANLSELIKKTLLCFCEINVNFTHKLEIYGSVHLKADGDDVISFLLNERSHKGGVAACQPSPSSMGVFKEGGLATPSRRGGHGADLAREAKVSSNHRRSSEGHSTPNHRCSSSSSSLHSQFSDDGRGSRLPSQPESTSTPQLNSTRQSVPFDQVKSTPGWDGSLAMDIKQEPMDDVKEESVNDVVQESPLEDSTGWSSRSSMGLSSSAGRHHLQAGNSSTLPNISNVFSETQTWVNVPTVDNDMSHPQGGLERSIGPMGSCWADTPMDASALKSSHLQSTTIDPEKTCPMCLKNFSTKTMLRLHMERRHKAQPHYLSSSRRPTGKARAYPPNSEGSSSSTSASSEGFHCTQCPRVFVTKLGLSQHFKGDHQHLRYACTLCTATFKSRDGLSCHMNVLHNVMKKSYPCPICHKTFLTRQACYTHKLKCRVLLAQDQLPSQLHTPIHHNA